jgi:proteic killer suppression protein
MSSHPGGEEEILWASIFMVTDIAVRSAAYFRHGQERRFTIAGEITLDVINARRYIRAVIKSFRGRETKKLFHREYHRKLPQDVQKVAMRKVWMIDAAPDLNSLRVPPGNRLEALSGHRLGQHSIRINDQWRICFRWHDGNAYDVEIVDYH